ncbi:hypothetical protein QQ045_026170 [Rhodiola kirilowii]
MAKKKSNAKAEQQQAKVRMHEDGAELPKKATDDSKNMLQNLKSLNAVLVKQAHELRVERSTLMSVNEVLELENGRLELEKADVEDAAVRSGLEKEVMAVVVGIRVEEMRRCGLDLVEGVEKKLKMVEREVEDLKSEKESAVGAWNQLGEYSVGVEKERDALKVEVEARTEEVYGLKAKVTEMLERENESVQVLQMLKEDNEAAVRAKLERDVAIEILQDEKDSISKSLGQSLAYGENLKDEIGKLSREKHFVETEKNEKLIIIDRLDKEMYSLRESVLVLQAEAKRLQGTISELEKSNAELALQRDGLSTDCAVLKNENKESEGQIGNLLSEKAMLTQAIDKSASDLANTVKETEKVKVLLQTKIVESREAHKTELGEMQEMSCHLKGKLECTRQGYETLIQEKKKLIYELAHLRTELEVVIAENDRAQKDIQLEKKNVERLTHTTAELEISIKESAKEIQRLGDEKIKLNEAKEAAEAQVEQLVKEKDILHERLKDADKDINIKRANTESARIMSDIILSALKKTSSQLQASGDLVCEVEQFPSQNEVVKPFMNEMKAITNAFQIRKVAMADIKKQLQMLKHSIAEAENRKSFWKLVSSATTIFAAASIAYASRRH